MNKSLFAIALYSVLIFNSVFAMNPEPERPKQQGAKRKIEETDIREIESIESSPEVKKLKTDIVEAQTAEEAQEKLQELVGLLFNLPTELKSIVWYHILIDIIQRELNSDWKEKNIKEESLKFLLLYLAPYVKIFSGEEFDRIHGLFLHERMEYLRRLDYKIVSITKKPWLPPLNYLINNFTNNEQHNQLIQFAKDNDLIHRDQNAFPSFRSPEEFKTFMTKHKKGIYYIINNIMMWHNSPSYLTTSGQVVLEDPQELPLINLNLVTLHLNQDFPQVKVLSLDYNLLTKLTRNMFTGLNNLVVLSLIHNQIQSIEPKAFNQLPLLESLELSDNKLSQLSTNVFDNLKKLTYLDIARNQLVSIPSGIFYDLNELQILNLSFNKLSSLPFDIFNNLSHLQELLLHNNELIALQADTFNSLTSLTALALNDNKLNSLPPLIFDNLTQLRYLQLYVNELTDLSPEIFANLKLLESLDLSKNMLKRLPLHIFDNFKQLNYLYLDNNLLDDSLDPSIFFPLASLEALYLRGNNFSKAKKEELREQLSKALPEATIYF